MAVKMEEPISYIRGWVNVWITIAVARSYSCMIHISQLPSPLLDREPDWESGLVMELAQ